MTDHPDYVIRLAKSLWKQSHTKPWDSWERSRPEVRESFLNAAVKHVTEIRNAVLAEINNKENKE